MTDRDNPISIGSRAVAFLARDPDFELVGLWLEAHLAGDRTTFVEYATDTYNSRGHSVRNEVARAERDRIVREIAERFSGGRGAMDQARRLCSELARYEADTLPRTREIAENPHPPTSKQALYWRYFKMWPKVLKDGQMRRVIRQV